ncbi:uncharacterized protein LOC110459217 [Mizuhopecten yessoensis]|uniref:Uncharacterized protein n=1 Tax=Mizuhopecten yessoensis TaxID=6573 RepID=A0A210Q4U9_MIZYE|nr:uncharacterized protein LOC110459217 [Mizuhopecten yessoensis]OWF43764.1 hypothetical protein KP79_PYT12645 [Mizuhopecten yessoensis]
MEGNMLILVTFIIFVPSVFTKMFILQADNSRTRENHMVINLGNASNGNALLITEQEPLSINFCIREKTTVRLNNFRFSIDNENALFTVNLDHGYWLGTYYSPPRGGREDFIDTGAFPRVYNFDAGWHVLKVDVRPGSANITVDNIEFEITDERMNLDILQCSIMCIQEAKFVGRHPSQTAATETAYISQQSYDTKCAEVDNVNIPIYNPEVSQFLITATLPQYKSFANRRHDNLTNCPHLPPQLWRFSDFTASSDTERIQGKNSSLIFIPKDFSSRKSIAIIASFKLEGEKEGSIDSKIGNELYLRFRNLSVPVTVMMQYRENTGRLSDASVRTFDPHSLEHMWTIPDFTWIEDTENYIVLSMEADVNVKFEVSYLQLIKRPMVPDAVSTIYRSDDVIIEAVNVQLSWLAPKTMTVRLSSGGIAENITFIRIYRPIPWNNGYAQVFVLYNDGNVRLLPTAPEGTDWIPFGTSVIVGQTKSDRVRPYTVITQVDIIPERWQMKVYYEDGSSVKMSLNSTSDETQLLVSDMDFMQDRFTHPFATIRSMYVDEGNTDVDSVKIDNKQTYHIMDKWGSLDGRSFAFHRRCISTHLTLSPDIQVDILETKQATTTPQVSPNSI